MDYMTCWNHCRNEHWVSSKQAAHCCRCRSTGQTDRQTAVDTSWPLLRHLRHTMQPASINQRKHLLQNEGYLEQDLYLDMTNIHKTLSLRQINIQTTKSKPNEQTNLRLPTLVCNIIVHNTAFQFAIRIDSLCDSNRFVMRIDSFCKKKSAFRFTSCHAVLH